MSIYLYGIRHHGPGSARSLARALETLQPDIVLVEGPPDANDALALTTHKDMQPPVALLVYNPASPEQAAYYPFAVYSPEWQAIRYARTRGIPVRFMDLPQTHRLAMEAGAHPTDPIAEGVPGGVEPAPEPEYAEPLEEPESPADPLLEILRFDPLQAIAQAAGYSDGETWWEHFVEERRDAADQFAAIQEMMTALREASPLETPLFEQQREAWMRQVIRGAQKEGFQKIAVVCGAWHTPALAEMPAQKNDSELLKGLPGVKTAATWIPWTYGRLTASSGYGAGVRSPAWYEHLWGHPHGVVEHWLTRTAALLRAEDLPASTASVIEAVRLAHTLAAVRDRPLAGLPELMEASRAIFCFGSDLPMRLVQEKLVVGEKLGKVPEETPMLPIQVDLRREQRRLKMEPSASFEDKDFDLRKPTDLERSHLLHRLNLLGIPWGNAQRQGGGKGTFHELWRLQWYPEFEVRLIEANVWGNSVCIAATARVQDIASKAETLDQLTRLVEPTLNASLPEAVPPLMQRLQNLAAITSDIPHLMDALPPLANVLRYGNVRQTDTEAVGHVVDGLLTRIVIGLPGACSSLDDPAADAMFGRIMAVHGAVSLLQQEDYRENWHSALARLSDLGGIHGLVAGRACRLLLDGGVYDTGEIGRRLSVALSTASEPEQAADWVEGLLKGSGEILLHTDTLWQILDSWLVELPNETFIQLLPLLRRTFASFPQPLRRQMGERVKTSGPTSVGGGATQEREYNRERAERVLPLVGRLLGLAP